MAGHTEERDIAVGPGRETETREVAGEALVETLVETEIVEVDEGKLQLIVKSCAFFFCLSIKKSLA
jgi:hypothetical protein